MKRILALVLVLVILSATLISCKNNEQVNSGGENTVSTDDSVEAPPYDSAIDALNFEGKEITFMVADVTTFERKEFYRESELDDGDAVNLAVHQRNLGVKEKLKVDLNFIGIPGTEIQDELDKYVASGDNYVDVITIMQSSGMKFVTQGAFLDLTKLPYLNTDSPWWNSSWNEATQIKGARYSVVGDANTTLMKTTLCCFINLDLLKNQYPENTPDLLELARGGGWTLEYVQTLVKNVYEDNGTVAGIADENDTYGMALAAISQPAQGLLASMGFVYSARDAAGNVSLTLRTQKNIDIMGEIHEFFRQDKVGIYHPDENPKSVEWYIDLFAKGRQMVSMAPMHSAETLTTTDIDYVVLPMPKADIDQESYRSSAQDAHTQCAISAASTSAEQSAAVLEYMGYLSKKDLTPKYYDVIYKARYASNEDTMELFDMIIDNIVFDFAICWTASLNRIMHNVRGLAADPNEGISSGLKSIEDGTKGYLANLMAELNK